MTDCVHIASLIVHVRPEFLAPVTRWIGDHSELELHLSSPQGKLVVVMESQNHFDINTVIETMKDQRGVLNVALVYHEELAQDELEKILVEDAAEQAVRIVGEH